MHFLLEDKAKQPSGFLTELVTTLADDSAALESVFAPVLLGLAERMKNCSLADKSYKYPLEAMAQLCEIRKDSPSNRPICDLVSNIVILQVLSSFKCVQLFLSLVYCYSSNTWQNTCPHLFVFYYSPFSMNLPLSFFLSFFHSCLPTIALFFDHCAPLPYYHLSLQMIVST